MVAGVGGHACCSAHRTAAAIASRSAGHLDVWNGMPRERRSSVMLHQTATAIHAHAGCGGVTCAFCGVHQAPAGSALRWPGGARLVSTATGAPPGAFRPAAACMLWQWLQGHLARALLHRQCCFTQSATGSPSMQPDPTAETRPKAHPKDMNAQQPWTRHEVQAHLRRIRKPTASRSWQEAAANSGTHKLRQHEAGTGTHMACVAGRSKCS